MAEIVEFELVAKTSGAVDSVNKVDKAVQKTGRSAKKTSKELSAFAEGGKQLVSALDRMTGGLASKFLAVGKAAKLSGKAMKTALISSGIGLAVVALALIVEYWDDIKGLVDGVSGEQAKQLKATEDTLAAQEQQLDTISKSENILKLQGKTEKEILAMKKQVTDESIATTKILLEQQKQTKKSQIEAAERNQNITKGIIAFLTAPIVVLLGLVDGLTNSLATLGILDEGTKLTEGFLELSSAMLFDPEAVAESGDKTIKATEDALLKLENTRAGYLVKDKEAAKTAANDKKNDEIEAEKEKAAALERIRKGLIDTEAEERAEKLRLIKQDYDEQIALAAKFYGANSIQVLQLKAAQKAALDAQQAVFDETDKARQDKLDEEEKKRKEKQLADDKKISDAAIKIADEERKAKQTALDGYAGAVSSLSNTIGQETAAGKGLAVASALISTYAAITATLENAAKTPAGGIPGYAIAQSIATGIAGLAAVKKIVAVKVPGGGGSGSSQTGSLPTAPTPPAFNVVGASGETQLADAIGSQTQRPARAYVVSNDVTKPQELDRNIIEGASI